MIKLEDIRIRDPFILVDNGLYYMYGTTDLGKGTESFDRFSVYISDDLKNFIGPKIIFDGKEADFWADRDYWAAEVYKYNEKYYLFGSFKADGCKRATQILVCDRPDGKFVPLSETARTPIDWQCLDGTFYVENGTPYMVFCREWTEIGDGAIYALELTKDLKDTVGEPFLLFKASENPLVESISVCGAIENITDGPFLLRENGKTKMTWSSFVSGGRYAVLEAEAESIRAKWHHKESRFDFDGGHAMVFEDLNGTKFFSLHCPNVVGKERACFIPYVENERDY